MATVSSFSEDPSVSGAPAERASTQPAPAFVVETLLNGSRACTSVVAHIGTRHGINADEWLILDTLAGNDGLSMSQIASRALSSGATLTRTIDRLVSLSLVYREVSATDRRKVLVFLSDLGQSKHSAMNTDVRDFDSILQDTLTAGGVDPELLAQVLPKIWELRPED